jgi:hypothetical protein
MYEFSSCIRREARGEAGQEIPVCPFAKSAVATTILVIVVPNVGGERGSQRLSVFAISRVGVLFTGGGDGDLGIGSRGGVCHWVLNWHRKLQGYFMKACYVVAMLSERSRPPTMMIDRLWQILQCSFPFGGTQPLLQPSSCSLVPLSMIGLHWKRHG